MNMTNLPGAEHEIEFWKGFVKSDRFINGWLPDNIKTPDLVQEVADFFLSRPDATVLDCGSGVVSILRGTVPNDKLTTCDPLGSVYYALFRSSVYFRDNEPEIKAPLPIQAEDLPIADYAKSLSYPPPIQFDIVHISNALDHAQNPVVAYQAMYNSVKPGRYLVVQGFVNEGTFEKWEGMHQWDLDIERNKLTLTDKTRLCITLASDPYLAKKIELESGKEWFIFVQQKPSE